MKILRRNFFATLLAPILVKFAPKSGRRRVFSEKLLLKAYRPLIQPGTIEKITWFAPDGMIYEIYDGRVIAISHFHVRPPVMRWTKPQDPTKWEPVDWKDEA